MKNRSLIPALCAAASCGCSHRAGPAEGASYTILGAWTNDSKSGDAAQVVDFKNDGTLTITGLSPKMRGLHIVATATYRVSDNRYTMKPLSLRLIPPTDANARTIEAIKVDNRALANPAVYEKAAVDSGTIKWLNRNAFLFIDKNGKRVRFTRKA